MLQKIRGSNNVDNEFEDLIIASDMSKRWKIHGATYCNLDLAGRALFIIGGLIMLICQVAVGAIIASVFGMNGQGTFSKELGNGTVGLICIYVAAFAWSWGPLGWLVPSEVFPMEIRSAGQSITVSVNMFFTFVIGQLFLTMLCDMKFGLFFFFGGFVMIMTQFIMFFLPETKGIPIEEVNRIWKNHWFWKKYMPVDDIHA
ncbi:hypothetical protein RND71_002372 [Anisodus tanguticus]|uniref:Major facilitator superfamily (MFS) profile domain-containing protein n=1 Tax=Anisodus tanguticus TaxID=243964 RepID=A0AAE1T2V4_9SOLA|nr:hypothetical protein RND71_002372 [Anisodus tanguticus]